MSQKKQIFKLDILRKFLKDANSCVSLVPSKRLLALPPFCLNDMKSGIFYLLNSILKKYDRSLDGIVIGYQNVKILMDENTGIIPIGSAETEVNVSVEFYIFQPKIGNTLEGVINKKSSTHIGCLVHRYFNATILKPEDVEYEDWNCKDFNVNDKILFKVKDLDFTGLLPYIEGVVSDEDTLPCARYKQMDDHGLDLPKNCESKIPFKTFTLKDSALESKKCTKENEGEEEEEEEETALYNNVNNLVNKILKEKEANKKKKKKKSKEKNSADERDQSVAPTMKTLISNNNDTESKNDDSNADKKKKKEKKNEKDVSIDSSISKFFKKEEKDILPDFIRQKFLIADDDSDLLKPVKRKKEKRKKDQEAHLSSSKICEGLPQHDELFYSTQLEPSSEVKMNASCSPIPKGISNSNDKPESSSILGKEKKKHKKRKTEDSGDGSAAKRVKKNQTEASVTTDFVDELLRRELNKAKKGLTKFKENKEENDTKKNDLRYENLMKQAKSKIGSKKNEEADSDSISKKKKKHKDRKFKNGSMYFVEYTPEKVPADKSLFSDSEQSHQSPAKKNNLNGVGSTKKSLVQTMLDQFFKEEGKKLKSDSDRESLKESTKQKKETKPETPSKKTEESLYEKLLREARSRIEVREDSPPKKKRKTK